MTPAPPHPEQEQKYIITEFELRTLTECAGTGFGILADNTAICIRSRPHTTTQSERDKVILDAFSDLIHNESVRPSSQSANMVYSYRVAQIIEELRTPPEAQR